MKKLNRRSPPHRYQEDIDKLIKVAGDNDYYLSEADADWVWTNYSDMYAASWITMYEDDVELWRIIREYMDTED